MNRFNDQPHVPLFVRRLCPHSSEEELAEAAENWFAYMELIRRLHQRLKANGKLDELLVQMRSEQETLRTVLLTRLTSLLLYRAGAIDRQAEAQNFEPPNS